MTKFLSLIPSVQVKNVFNLNKLINIPNRFEKYIHYFEREFINNNINNIES